MAHRSSAALLALLLAVPALCAPPDGGFESSLDGFTPPAQTPFRFQNVPAAASAPSLFAGLKLGARDEAANGPVRRLQAALFGRWLAKLNFRRDWAAAIERDEPAVYGEGTARAVTLFKAVYGTGRDGTSIDDATARLLSAVESGTFWTQGLAPSKSPGGETLYRAARFLGAPYQMGGSGLASGSMDCGLLTKTALEDGGVLSGGAGLTRLADYQYDDAAHGRFGLTLRAAGSEPRAGDLVFFNCATSQSGIALGGVTHVGLALGNAGGEPLVLDARSSGVGVHAMMGCVKGYASVGSR